jgi:hypothetical protein
MNALLTIGVAVARSSAVRGSIRFRDWQHGER